MYTAKITASTGAVVNITARSMSFSGMGTYPGLCEGCSNRTRLQWIRAAIVTKLRCPNEWKTSLHHRLIGSYRYVILRDDRASVMNSYAKLMALSEGHEGGALPFVDIHPVFSSHVDSTGKEGGISDCCSLSCAI